MNSKEQDDACPSCEGAKEVWLPTGRNRGVMIPCLACEGTGKKQEEE